jgi:hypothetical protein
LFTEVKNNTKTEIICNVLRKMKSTVAKQLQRTYS